MTFLDQLMRRLLFLICGFTLTLSASAAPWRPISPEDLALKEPRSDRNADAEALFRDVRLLNEASGFGYPHNVISEYVRLKIFSERGRDKYGSVTLPYWGKSTISNVEGRTVKPDGAVIELKKDAIFDKVLVNKRGFKTKVITFALPGIEVGSIIEYRWTMNIGEFITRYSPLDVQSSFPTDELTFHIKPVSSDWVQWPAMRFMPFGCNIDSVSPSADGFTTISLHDIPAFHEEPYMPPEYGAKQWILVYYEENEHTGADKYWSTLGKELYAEYSRQIKVDHEAKQIAAEVTSGGVTEEEKLALLLAYCRRNLNGSDISPEDRDKAKSNTTTSDTLRRKHGTAEEITLAFAALASAAGFEARVARLSDRARFLFNPNYQSAYFLDSTKVAVKVKGSWKFFDVNNRDLALGELSWQEQGVYALILDPKKPEFVKTPLASSEHSQLARIGAFKLDAEGNLDGDLREYYSGNESSAWRQRFGRLNDSEREALIRDMLGRRFSEYELSNLQFAIPSDREKAIAVVYHLKIPNYAQRTGKRMFLHPAFFQAGFGTRFAETSRLNPIYFEYPWSESDYIEIQLPEGFSIDHGDTPSRVNFPPIGKYVVSMSVEKGSRLIYRRQLTFGSDQILYFDSRLYPLIKQIFEKVHSSDDHMLTLVPKNAVSASLTVH